MTSLVLSSPNVLQVIVHVVAGVFDVDDHVGRLQHLDGELVREGVNKQSPQGISTADLCGHPHLLCLLPILQEQHTWHSTHRQQRAISV